MAMSGDRLTRLPDIVLWQVLSHALAKEAVCTGALSQRWRSLWLSSGVLNLDSRSYGPGRSLVFLRDANAALDAIAATAASDEGSGLRKLMFTYLAPDNDRDMYRSRHDINDGLDALLTGAPARGLDELHVDVSPVTWYRIRLAALPSATLRALHLEGLELTPVLPFPWLQTMRLRQCAVRLTDIQAIVDAAPLLAALELYHVYIFYDLASSSSGPGLLCCPQVTALSLAYLRGWWHELELDAPSLRHFAYRGFHDAGVLVLNVSLEQPGARRRAEQIKELNLRIKDAVLLRL